MATPPKKDDDAVLEVIAKTEDQKKEAAKQAASAPTVSIPQAKKLAEDAKLKGKGEQEEPELDSKKEKEKKEEKGHGLSEGDLSWFLFFKRLFEIAAQSTIFKGIAMAAVGAARMVKGVLQAVPGSVYGAFTGNWSLAKDGLKNIGGGLGSIGAGLGTTVLAGVGIPLAMVGDVLTGGKLNLTGTVSNGISGLQDAAWKALSTDSTVAPAASTPPITPPITPPTPTPDSTSTAKTELAKDVAEVKKDTAAQQDTGQALPGNTGQPVTPDHDRKAQLAQEMNGLHAQAKALAAQQALADKAKAKAAQEALAKEGEAPTVHRPGRPGTGGGSTSG